MKPVVSFDNLEEGSSLWKSSARFGITSTEIDDRILGTSKNTGRSLAALLVREWKQYRSRKDAHRPMVVCNLSTDLERPEERDDVEIKDLRAHVSAHRGDCIRDALTILKAHAVGRVPKRGVGASWFIRGLGQEHPGAVGTQPTGLLRHPARARMNLQNVWKSRIARSVRELPRGEQRAEGVTVEEAICIAMAPRILTRIYVTH